MARRSGSEGRTLLSHPKTRGGGVRHVNHVFAIMSGRLQRARVRLLHSATPHAVRLLHSATPCACHADADYYQRAAQLDVELLVRARAEEAALEQFSEPLPCSNGDDGSAIADVNRHGVARLASCISQPTARALHEHCLAQLEAAEADPGEFDDGAEQSKFSAVLGAAATGEAVVAGEHSRWDLRLGLSSEVSGALREALSGPLGAALEAFVGAEGELHELACVIAAPGAAPQVVHADADWSPRSTMFTAFIALQDIGPHMGPTRFLRGTHTAEAHAARYGEEGRFDHVIAHADPRLAVLRAGDATLYDRRLLHAGGSNHSDTTRLLFYVTFRTEGADDADVANANSLRHEYAGMRLRLGQLREGAVHLVQGLED